jgi:hypothetical protein
MLEDVALVEIVLEVLADSILYIFPVPTDTTYRYPSGLTTRLLIPPKPSPNIMGSALGRSDEARDRELRLWYF